MIGVGDLRPGMTFQVDGNLYVVLEASHNKTAKSVQMLK